MQSPNQPTKQPGGQGPSARYNQQRFATCGPPLLGVQRPTPNRAGASLELEAVQGHPLIRRQKLKVGVQQLGRGPGMARSGTGWASVGLGEVGLGLGFTHVAVRPTAPRRSHTRPASAKPPRQALALPRTTRTDTRSQPLSPPMVSFMSYMSGSGPQGVTQEQRTLDPHPPHPFKGWASPFQSRAAPAARRCSKTCRWCAGRPCCPRPCRTLRFERGEGG